jgi:hypothetical protein
MTVKHSIEFTCDACGTKTESHDDYGWAAIDVSGSTEFVNLGQDQHYNLCPTCWVPIRRLIQNSATESRKSHLKEVP